MHITEKQYVGSSIIRKYMHCLRTCSTLKTERKATVFTFQYRLIFPGISCSVNTKLDIQRVKNKCANKKRKLTILCPTDKCNEKTTFY